MDNKFHFERIVTQNKNGLYRELQYKSAKYDLVVTEINDEPAFAHLCDLTTSDSVAKIANNGDSMFDKLMFQVAYMSNYIQDQADFNKDWMDWKIFVGPGRREIGGSLEELEAILESVDRLKDMYDAIKGTQKVIAEKYGKKYEFYGQKRGDTE